MASTAHFSEEEMAELREAFSKVGEYERKGVRSCSWLFAPTLTIHGETEFTPTLICCVTETTASPACPCRPPSQNHSSTLQSSTRGRTADVRK